jgi:hypothetical protein
LKTMQQLSALCGPCDVSRLAPLREELAALDQAEDLYGGNVYLVDLLQRLRMESAELAERIGVQFFSHTGKVDPAAS